MARPVKKGLDYFPLDVDFDTNEKTEAIMGEFGAKGTLIFVFLLAAIYRKGYYLEWNELAKNQLANRVQGATGELVQRVVDRLVVYGVFNKELFNSAEVLTSQRIQETYSDAVKRRKTQKPTLYWINVDINPHSTGVNDDINPQSKVKESKEKTFIHDDAPKLPADQEALLKRWQEVAAAYAQFISVSTSPKREELLHSYLEDFEPDVIVDALERSSQMHDPWKYFIGIMKKRDQANLNTIAKVKQSDEEYKRVKTGRPRKQSKGGGSYAGIEF
ncbi:Lin1244/Lin1753 domain-containing protein [Schleiferilactobacillus harbinensis]|uniref:DUF4373 domain-containing protein n=1 Tax=Schleiferilactobacillus harbinensis TaxID=304207 RepID=A0A5P8M3W6_9LACO|nr:Lin1244/Lin1753 domain-containing protein [Schleiferilactobacillus harbinensis]QFR22984.1 DUF4373 domain-containing protein [Schleiferilactobacillus harbinensis]